MAEETTFIDSLPKAEQAAVRAWVESENDTPLAQANRTNDKIDLSKEMMDVLYKTNAGKLLVEFLNELHGREAIIDFGELNSGDTVKLVAEKCGRMKILDEIREFIDNHKRLAVQEKITIPSTPTP